jgi:hypothetical protein
MADILMQKPHFVSVEVRDYSLVANTCYSECLKIGHSCFIPDFKFIVYNYPTIN